MYCKHCGSQIADDSVFCVKCGKRVVEARSTLRNETTVTSQPNETKWWTTDNLQWKKPTTARGVQIGMLIILGLLSLYPLWCIISGGEVEQCIYGSGYVRDLERVIHVKDPWELKIFKCTWVDIHGYYISKSDAQGVFSLKMSLMLLPLVISILLTIRWIKRTRFPGEKDIVPRDVADEIEQYEWHGFTRDKYVFYKKDGKFGIIDARNYCVNVPAQYDSIVWRMPNKTYDIMIGEEKQTIAIQKSQPFNPNKKKLSPKKCFGIFLTIWGTFWIIADFIAIFDPKDESELGAYVFVFVLAVVSLLGAIFCFIGDKK